MNEYILLELLQKINDNTVSISNKHKPYLNKLKSYDFVKYENGEWLVTDYGKEYLNDNQAYWEDKT